MEVPLTAAVDRKALKHAVNKFSVCPSCKITGSMDIIERRHGFKIAVQIVCTACSLEVSDKEEVTNEWNITRVKSHPFDFEHLPVFVENVRVVMAMQRLGFGYNEMNRYSKMCGFGELKREVYDHTVLVIQNGKHGVSVITPSQPSLQLAAQDEYWVFGNRHSDSAVDLMGSSSRRWAGHEHSRRSSFSNSESLPYTAISDITRPNTRGKRKRSLETQVPSLPIGPIRQELEAEGGSKALRTLTRVDPGESDTSEHDSIPTSRPLPGPLGCSDLDTDVWGSELDILEACDDLGLSFQDYRFLMANQGLLMFESEDVWRVLTKHAKRKRSQHGHRPKIVENPLTPTATAAFN